MRSLLEPFEGLLDSVRATQDLPDRLDLPVEQVLICSTGVIGVPIPIAPLLAGLNPLVEALNDEGGAEAATVILVSDLIEQQLLHYFVYSLCYFCV